MILGTTKTLQVAKKLAVKENCAGMVNQRHEIRTNVSCCAPKMAAFLMVATFHVPQKANVQQDVWMFVPEPPATAKGVRILAAMKRSFASMDLRHLSTMRIALTSVLSMAEPLLQTVRFLVHPESQKELSIALTLQIKFLAVNIRLVLMEVLLHGTKKHVWMTVKRIRLPARALTFAQTADPSRSVALNGVT